MVNRANMPNILSQHPIREKRIKCTWREIAYRLRSGVSSLELSSRAGVLAETFPGLILRCSNTQYLAVLPAVVYDVAESGKTRETSESPPCLVDKTAITRPSPFRCSISKIGCSLSLALIPRSPRTSLFLARLHDKGADRAVFPWYSDEPIVRSTCGNLLSIHSVYHGNSRSSQILYSSCSCNSFFLCLSATINDKAVVSWSLCLQRN